MTTRFDARKELFEIYINKFDRPSEELDFDELAKLTENYVASDIENICDEVFRCFKTYSWYCF